MGAILTGFFKEEPEDTKRRKKREKKEGYVHGERATSDSFVERMGRAEEGESENHVAKPRPCAAEAAKGAAAVGSFAVTPRQRARRRQPCAPKAVSVRRRRRRRCSAWLRSKSAGKRRR